MKRLILCMILSLTVVIAPPARGNASEDLNTVIDRVIAAYGGEAVLSRIKVIRQSGTTVHERHSDEPGHGHKTGTLLRVFQPPDRLRVEITVPGHDAQVRVLNGAGAWHQGIEVSTAMRAAMQLQAARLAAPFLVLERRDSIRDRGMGRTSDGTELRVLDLPLGPHRVLRLGVDMDTGRVARSFGILAGVGQGTMQFATVYADFRTWDGLLIAGREDQYAMGQYAGYSIIEKVEFLDQVDPGVFQP